MKKILSIILSCAMIMSLLTFVPVFAEDVADEVTEGTTEEVVIDPVELTKDGITIEMEDYKDSITLNDVTAESSVVRVEGETGGVAGSSGGKTWYFDSNGTGEEKTGRHVDVNVPLDVKEGGLYSFELVAWYYAITPKFYIDDELVEFTKKSAKSPWTNAKDEALTNIYKIEAPLKAGDHTLKMEFYEGGDVIGGKYQIVFHADCINVSCLGKISQTLNPTGTTIVEAEDFVPYIVENGVKADPDYPQIATTTNSTSGITFTQVKYDSAATSGTGATDVYVDFKFPVVAATKGTYAASFYGWYYGLDVCDILVNDVKVEKTSKAHDGVYYTYGKKISTKNYIELDEGENTITLRVFETPANEQIVCYLNHMEISLIRTEAIVGKTAGAERLELEAYQDKILNPFNLTNPSVEDLAEKYPAGTYEDYTHTEKLLVCDSQPYFTTHDPEKYIGIELPVTVEDRGLYNISLVAQTYEQHTDVYVNNTHIGRTDFAKTTTADTRTGGTALAGKYTFITVLDKGENTIKLEWYDRPVGNASGNYNIYFRADYLEVEYVQEIPVVGIETGATRIELEDYLSMVDNPIDNSQTIKEVVAEEDGSTHKLLYIDSIKVYEDKDRIYLNLPVNVETDGFYKLSYAAWSEGQNTDFYIDNATTPVINTKNASVITGTTYVSPKTKAKVYSFVVELKKGYHEINLQWLERADLHDVIVSADYLELEYVYDREEIGADDQTKTIELENYVGAVKGVGISLATGTYGLQAKEDANASGGKFLYVGTSSYGTEYDATKWAEFTIPVTVKEASFYKFGLSGASLSADTKSNSFVVAVNGTVVAEFAIANNATAVTPYGGISQAKEYKFVTFLKEGEHEITVRLCGRKVAPEDKDAYYDCTQWVDYLKVTKSTDTNYISLSDDKAYITLSQPATGTLVIAFYDKDNKFLGMNTKEIKDEISIEKYISYDTMPEKAKVFVWTALSSANPVLVDIDLTVRG